MMSTTTITATTKLSWSSFASMLCAMVFLLLAQAPTKTTTTALTFFGSTKKQPTKVIIKSSPMMEEAVAIFNKKYPFGRDPPKTIGLGNFGMPNRDIDGTVLVKEKKNDASRNKKRLTDITEQEAKETFATLASVYGEDRALEMVKALPLCLAFDKSIFAQSYQEWAELFGAEESKDMVKRNPGLLAVRPDEAAKATDQTMIFSYLVSTTRPLGPVLLPTLLILLLIPSFEYVTGISIRGGL